jgi:hypothetical protein
MGTVQQLMTTETVERLALQHIQQLIQDVLDGKGLPSTPEPVITPAGQVSLLPVPYRSQLGSDADKYNNDCGAASGAMLVEAYTGKKVPVTEFYEATGSKSDQYLSAVQIMKVLDQYGVSSRWVTNQNLYHLFDHLYGGRPLIALVHYKDIRDTIQTESAFSGPHFVVVVGMDTRNVYVHDPLWKGAGGQALPIPLAVFNASWQKTPGNSVQYAAVVPFRSLMDTDDIPGTRVRVTADVLNVRTGPGVENSLVGGLRKGEVVKVVETQGDWGMIGPQEWIHMGYTEKI